MRQFSEVAALIGNRRIERNERKNATGPSPSYESVRHSYTGAKGLPCRLRKRAPE